MSENRKPFNPFYVLLLVAGVVFSITAVIYGIMTVRDLHRSAGQPVSASESWERMMVWLDQHGFSLMMIELAVLGIFTFAAIATDDYWEKRARRNAKRTTENAPVAGDPP